MGLSELSLGQQFPAVSEIDSNENGDSKTKI